MAKKLAKKDYDKDGKVESPSDEYKGAKDKAIKKARGGKVSKEKKLNESESIVAFINAISSKNYSQANKYLKGIMDSKIENRISASLNEPLF
jgi:hypothetical protein